MRWATGALALALACASASALAHGGGGGGGGGHGGGSYVYVPIYGGTAPVVVPDAKTGDYSHIKTVAIISAIGQKLTLGSVALLASHKDIDIADWKLDENVESTLSHYLGGRFTVKQVAYDRADLAAIPNGHYDTDSAKALQAYLARLHASDVDAFVVVRPDSEAQASPTPGLSIDNAEGYPVEQANYEIDIVDAHSYAILGHAMSRVALRQGVPASFAAIVGSLDVNLTSKDTPTDAQRAKLKNHFARLLWISLRETLRPLNLGIALPPVGARDLIPIPADKNPLRKVHTVAIVSAVGDQLQLDHRGAFFKHEEGSIPIGDWGLDREIEASVAAALDKRLAVKTIPADRAKIAALDIPFDPKALAVPVAGLTPTSDVDLYIVVLRHVGMIPGVVDKVSGFGLWHWTPMGDAERTAIFASYAIALVEPHTLKIGWLQRGVASPQFPSEIPLRETANAYWPADMSKLSPAQESALHQTIAAMMTDSVGETLLHMALTGMMVAPPPGVTDTPPEPGAMAGSGGLPASPTAQSPGQPVTLQN